MLSYRVNRPRRCFKLLLLLPVLVGCRSSRHAAEPLVIQTEVAPPSVAVATSATLTLTECLKLANERQPRLAAQRASLATAEDFKRALDKLHLPATLDAQIPLRRKQADLGVAAALAGLGQAERETVYAVTRTYLTVLYAREQERVAKSVVERLTATKEAAQRGLDAGTRDVTATDVNRTVVYLRLAETRRIQATDGVKRALVALREAIGLGPDVTIDVPPGRLTEPTANPNRDEVLTAALSKRGDLLQVSIFAQLTCLEVDAQKTGWLTRMQTFAAGSDIHATPVPQGSNGTEYRPAAVPPEMPNMLVGSRAERIKQAQTLVGRAESVIETTRNLITVEVEDAFLRWEAASKQTKEAKAAAEAGDTMAEDLRKDFAAGLKVKVEEVVSSRVLAAQARSEYNQFLHQQLLALADLERATAGGFCAGLAELIVAENVTPK